MVLIVTELRVVQESFSKDVSAQNQVSVIKIPITCYQVNAPAMFHKIRKAKNYGSYCSSDVLVHFAIVEYENNLRIPKSLEKKYKLGQLQAKKQNTQEHTTENSGSVDMDSMQSLFKEKIYSRDQIDEMWVEWAECIQREI
ncbi:hypothetical protein ACS0TY_026288 [Phlomoides rotata]